MGVAPAHPVRIVVDDELERSRLTVAFRLFLAIPHFVWFALWSLVVPFAALAAWIAALARGSVPSSLHDFLAAYVRYAVHLSAFVHVVGRSFPGFLGREGTYGIDVLIDPPTTQNRWKTAGRLVLAIPAFVLVDALAGVLFVVGVLGWFASLVTGRMPGGLRDLGAVCLRYTAQTLAYVLLLTDRYPQASPHLDRTEPYQGAAR